MRKVSALSTFSRQWILIFPLVGRGSLSPDKTSNSLIKDLPSRKSVYRSLMRQLTRIKWELTYKSKSRKLITWAKRKWFISAIISIDHFPTRDYNPLCPLVNHTLCFSVACTRPYNPLYPSVCLSVCQSVTLSFFSTFYTILSHFKSFQVIQS